MLSDVKGLNRHKSAGLDGLSNAFYKKTVGVMFSTLGNISNQIIEGSELLPSFLESLVLPFRKKGDSDDSMYYRPIAFLRKSYKVFTKVLATRLQHALPRTTSDSQQRFFHGRKNGKVVYIDVGSDHDCSSAGRHIG